jgi:nucleoside diphosphate kinase
MGKLKIFADFATTAPNIVSNYQCEDKKEAERTLVIIKPDNWRFPSSKPGNIIDMFSRTGLRIVGCKIYQMSVADALEFYGPVRDVLRDKLAPKIGQQAREILEKELQMKLKVEDEKIFTGSVGMEFADNEFSKIVEFMSGLKPESCPPQKLNDPGLVKCMVLVYEGKNAVKKIRDVLGPTDPTKAPAGTIRKEFGFNVMINTAHASDSPDNAKREMGIVRIQNNNMTQIIKDFLKERTT